MKEKNVVSVEDLTEAERSIYSANLLASDRDDFGMVNRVGNGLRIMGEVLMQNDQESLSNDQFWRIADMTEKVSVMLRQRSVK